MSNELRLFAGLFALAFAPMSLACNVSATSVNFGSVDPLDARVTDSAGQITVACPSATAYTISFDGGAGADVADRRMSGGAQSLHYQLYVDATRSVTWGDGTAGTMPVSGEANTLGTTHTVYGRIPPQPSATPGIYADSLLITITY